MIVVELIFLAGLTGALYGAFWCGAKYGTLKVMWLRVKAAISGT